MKAVLNYMFLLSFSFQMIGQIGMANHYPTLKPSHILDENKEDISFAFGMRVLESDYNGPLIRLRRDGHTNAQAVDFYCNDQDRLDLDAVNAYAAGNTLYVVIWYDQSGLARNAVQTDVVLQPVFTPDTNYPHFNSDDSEDFLVVETSAQILTDNGKNGTNIGVFYATDNNNHSFGIRDNSIGSNRWLAHINWPTDDLFFDPGSTGSNRSIDNTANIDLWKQYTLARRDNPLTPAEDEIVFRINSVRINNTAALQTYPDANQLTGDFYFGIGATISRTITSGNPYDTFRHSTTKFCEFILYAAGKDDSFIQTIEENQIAFWGL